LNIYLTKIAGKLAEKLLSSQEEFWSVWTPLSQAAMQAPDQTFPQCQEGRLLKEMFYWVLGFQTPE
jgi:hypothetical protein